MKKISKLVCGFVFIISIFSCTREEGKKMITEVSDLMAMKANALKRSRKYELASKEMADKILECINSKDIDGLYELFSEEVKNSDIDLKVQIKNLFDVIRGELKGNKGGKSIETEWNNKNTGDKIYEHTLTNSDGTIFDDHYRPYPKQLKPN